MTAELQAPDQPQPKPLDPEAYGLECVLKSLIQLGASLSPRALSGTIGISDAGKPCDRQLAYKHNRTQPSNLPDPLASLVGIGFHLAMAQLFTRLDAGTGRFLIEQSVSCRGIPGTFDLYDRAQRTLFDWKTTTLARLKRIRSEGPPTAHVVQTQLYGQALLEAGEEVKQLALVYIPIDSTLQDIHVWRTIPNTALVDKATERVFGILFANPVDATPNPSPLCGWCAYHNPHEADSNLSCKGQTK